MHSKTKKHNWTSKSLQNLLIRTRFDLVPKPIVPKKISDFKNVKIKSATVILTLVNNFLIVIYLIIYIKCEGAYIEETECLL